MNTTGQSVLSDGISSQEEPVDIINSPLNRVVEDNRPMVSTDFDLLDLPCKEEEEPITHGVREAGVEPAFDDTESHHIGPNIDSDSYQDRSVGFSKKNVNDEGSEKEDSSYEHKVEEHHYSDSPYGDGENEEENVQHRYTDSPFEFDDEDSEDEGIFMVDHIPTSYRDSPAPDDRDMDRAIGVMYGDDGRGPCPPMEEDEIVTTTRRRRTRRFRRRKKKHDEAPVNHRRRRQWCWLLLCCLLLLLLLLLIGGIAFGITRDDSDDPPDEEEDDGVAPDDDFTIFKPYEGITTTPMDPYTEDCYFGVNVFPHVAQQCKCGTRIDIIPDDVATLQSQVTEDINREIYEGMYTGDPSSCDPANQALIWLSSGNTRDAGDLFQRFVLSLSYFQMNGTNWDLNNLWLSDDSECIWLGLQCNSRFQVNSFAVDTNNVKGSFPTEMVRLNGLNTLSITRNHMTGTIPPELFSMRNLENLFLYANQMRGSIPSEVANAKKLKILSAGNNLFAGTLVSEIGQVSTLEQLDIGFNEFWLRLPTEMGQLTNMKYLVIEDNRFSGPMPSEFGRMSNLETFLLSQNLMKGPLPIDLTNLSNLHEWRFAHTGLGGDFPTEFGQAMTNLHRLEMGGNNFRGTIMTEFGYMTQLSWLALNGNDLTGTIPTEIGHLVNMTRLSLQDTLIEGTIPSEIGLMTKLENLNIDKNNLTGRAPEEICALRALELNLFVTDCEARGSVGIVCPIPDCCTFCRRGESSNSSP